ncbi:MAG: helix-turn-helix transcriptional regulator [Aquabacterium sp.]|nr:MAG: helix-turn-helix transcriptional regulator [Aquabacterium sp.]
MFELTIPMVAERAERTAEVAASAGGPRPLSAGAWLALMLDEIDYGMVLLSPDGRVQHMNHAARAELEGSPLLQVQQATLQVRRPQDYEPLRSALHDAAVRRRRRLVTLEAADQTLTIAVVPLGEMPQPATLLVLSKSRVCEELSLQGYASHYGLTLAEGQVLKALCAGQTPGNVAERHGVAISTIRTQIHAIRAKTGMQSISSLVQQIARLPPLMGALRCLAP